MTIPRPRCYAFHLRTLFVVATVFCCELIGCKNRPVAQPPLQASPAIASDSTTESQARLIVAEFVRSEKIDLTLYDPPTVEFDKGRQEWSFFYQMKPLEMYGGHFLILVDRLGAPRLIGGA